MFKIFAMLFATLLSFSSSAQIFPEDKKKEGSLVILEYIVSQENITCKRVIKKIKKAPELTEEQCNSLIASFRKKAKKFLRGDRLAYVFSGETNGWVFESAETQG